MKNKFLKNFQIFLILNSTFLILNSGKAQMYWNQAASFAGTSSSYIAVKNSTTLNIIGSFTLEAWVNPNPNSSTAIISTKGAVMDCPIVDSFGKDSYGERGGFSRFTFSASNKFISIFLTSKYLFYPDQMSWDVKSNN